MPSDIGPIAGISNDKLKTLMQAGAFGLFVVYMVVDLYRSEALLDRIEAGNAAENARFLAQQQQLFSAQDRLIKLVETYRCATPRQPYQAYEPLTAEEMDKRFTPRNQTQPLVSPTTR